MSFFVLVALPIGECAIAQVVEDDATLELVFGSEYVLTAALAQAEEFAGKIAFSITDLGAGDYQVSASSIAQLCALYEVAENTRFDANFANNNLPLTKNDNSINDTVIHLDSKESIFLGYWGDPPFLSKRSSNGRPDPLDNYGWVEVQRFAGALRILGSATASNTGIITGTAIQAEPHFIGDVNLDGTTDLLDVEPFVKLILSSGGFLVEADTNQDGVVDLLDVAGFVNLILGN